MSSDVDHAYHMAREAAERVAAGKAASDAARDSHLRLAERHADRAWSISEGYGDAD